MEQETIPSVFDQVAEYPQFEYATTGNRFVNFLIDTVVYYMFNIVVLFITGAALAISGKTAEDIQEIFSNKAVPYTMALANFILLYTVIEGASKGRSLGKLVTGTVAVQESLQPITWKNALLRTLCRMIPFEAFSALGGNPWHDSLTHTTVIKKQKNMFPTL